MTLFYGKTIYPDTRSITDKGTQDWARRLTLALEEINRHISEEFNRFSLDENDMYLSDSWRFTVTAENDCELQEYVGSSWVTRAKWTGS